MSGRTYPCIEVFRTDSFWCPWVARIHEFEHDFTNVQRRGWTKASAIHGVKRAHRRLYPMTSRREFLPL